MDANNFNPFDVSGRPEAHHATLQQPQAGQAGQEDFERRLVEVRQTDVAAAAGATPDSRYPHLTEKDRTLIEAVAEHFAGNLQSHTVGNYTWALRALGNHLASRGQTIDALDHDSLVWHASAFFPTDGSMGNALSALNALRKYREPKASDSSRRYAPSLEDASLIDSAIGAAAARRRWTPTTAVNYESTLRRLAKSLESQGQTIAALDHNSLVAHVKQSFGDNGNMASALEVLRECREPDILAARVPRQRDEYVPSMEDKALIDSAVLASGRPEHTVKHYTGKLYRFAGVLKNDGHGIAKLDHESLIRLAKGLYSRNKNLITGLNIIRDYRNAQGPAGAEACSRRCKMLIHGSFCYGWMINPLPRGLCTIRRSFGVSRIKLAGCRLEVWTQQSLWRCWLLLPVRRETVLISQAQPSARQSRLSLLMRLRRQGIELASCRLKV